MNKNEEPVHEHINVNGKGTFRITHEYFVGKEKKKIVVEETYNPYNSWDRYDAVNKAKERYKREYFNIKS